MRRFIFSTLAVACTFLVLAEPAQAQRRGGWGGGYGRGYSGGYSGNYAPYSSGFGYGNGYGYGNTYGFGNPGYSSNYRGGYYQPYGYGYGNNQSYYNNYRQHNYGYYTPGYTYTPNYTYNTVPNYDNSATYAVPNQPNVTSSGYMDANAAGSQVMLRVIVPDPNARVFVQDQETRQNGTRRLFYSPPLERGANYTYTIKASWMENGREVVHERRVDVTPGQEIEVNFTTDRGAATMPGTEQLPIATNNQPITNLGTIAVVTGEIVRIENEQIIFTEKGGRERTFRLAPGARVMVNGQQGELRSLQPGMQISLTPQSNSTSIATSIEVRQAAQPNNPPSPNPGSNPPPQ